MTNCRFVAATLDRDAALARFAELTYSGAPGGPREEGASEPRI
jgi:hypothetical protein